MSTSLSIYCLCWHTDITEDRCSLSSTLLSLLTWKYSHRVWYMRLWCFNESVSRLHPEQRVMWEMVDGFLMICISRADSLICLFTTAKAVLFFLPSFLSICCMSMCVCVFIYVCMCIYIITCGTRLCLCWYMWPYQDPCRPESYSNFFPYHYPSCFWRRVFSLKLWLSVW